MIKTRQKNIKAFELSGGKSSEYIDFITKNFVLLKDYLLIFKEPIEPEMSNLLQELQINYIFSQTQLRGRETQNSQELHPQVKTQIYQRNIRSGEEIESFGELVLLGNVNNGAKINSDKSISIFGKCDGVVICGGEYLILKSVYSGHIVFCGEILPQKIIEKINSNDLLKIITKNGDNISIKEIQ
ncbi:septum site-determining protein MinC [Helicobacter sp. 11S03491-1]|uniref:septum site-determining protein MinC n=1 Tax=Helicobacter sp. 11S03491-1 TaxID=1476196 RepID=UPI000BA5530B|nr:septum site-determining protein MinC [Helicobacter sp. 11S03491-1]PAF43333.1 hypothetical protein BKH45_01455 [Helicobacter sp. 11S03491-1]